MRRVHGVHKRSEGDLVEEFGECWVDVVPRSPDDGVRFENDAGEQLPDRFVPSIGEGVRDATRHGPTAGYPVTGVGVRCVAGEYDISVNYWTNDIIDPDQKASFSVYGDEANKSYYTSYKNPKVTELVDQGRLELDRAKREAIYHEIQKVAKEDVHWIDLYYSPFRNASRSNSTARSHCSSFANSSP